MRSRYQVHQPNCAYFITATIVKWLPVFTSTACCDVVVRALEHYRQHNALKIYAWVILDNQVHAILSAPDLSAVLRELKSYIAREILEQLQREGRDWLLNQLSSHRGAQKPNDFQVWQEDSNPQVISDEATMLQKLEDIHNNPVKRGWVAAPAHWRYSSAHAWLGGAPPLLRCDHWR